MFLIKYSTLFYKNSTLIVSGCTYPRRLPSGKNGDLRDPGRVMLSARAAAPGTKGKNPRPASKMRPYRTFFCCDTCLQEIGRKKLIGTAPGGCPPHELSSNVAGMYEYRNM